MLNSTCATRLGHCGPRLTDIGIVPLLTVVLWAIFGATEAIAQPPHPNLPNAEALSVSLEPAGADTPEMVSQLPTSDRLWLISSRRLTSNVCRANLDNPAFSVYRMNCRGSQIHSSLDDYFHTIGQHRPVVVYVHGNRLDADGAIKRSFNIYQSIRKRRCSGPIDWVVFSWPSAKQGRLIHDFREKAERTDAQGLYLGWLLRKHAESSLRTGLIGYSFGARIVTGALHAMAGGCLDGRRLPGSEIIGANFDAGLIAPALESHWMEHRGYHGKATKNLDHLVLLFNRRDAILKRYWLLDRVRSSVALGYSGPQAFGLRADGSKLSVRARDCARFMGLRHDEVDYYSSRCGAGAEMATLIHDIDITH